MKEHIKKLTSIYILCLIILLGAFSLRLDTAPSFSDTRFNKSQDNIDKGLVVTEQIIKDRIALCHEEMLPWQIEQTKEFLTGTYAQPYLDSIGRLRGWYEDFYTNPQDIACLSEKHASLLDNVHFFINFCLMHRSNIALVAIQDYKGLNYCIINSCYYDGEIGSSIVKSDKNDAVIDIAGGSTPNSSGFYANVAYWPEATIVYGVIHKTRLGGVNCDEILQTDFVSIAIYAKTGEKLIFSFDDPNYVLVFLEPSLEVDSINMLDSNGDIAEIPSKAF